MAVRNPYAGVDWSGVQVRSISHTHGRTKTFYDSWLAQGYQHLAISNYYPSDPADTYPLTAIPDVDAGDVPDDVIGCPNAEHHSFSNAPGHVNAIGSMFASGTPNPGGTGYGGTWQAFLADVFAELLYPDGGGVSINHPTLSWVGHELALQWLDYDERVLGIEVYNHLGEWNYPAGGWARGPWHRILVTGRRCFGFAVLDHWVQATSPAPLGENVLLLPAAYALMSRTQREQACAEAYRQGHWYMRLATTSPVLAGVTANETEVSVTFGESCDITWYYGHVGDTSARTLAGGTGTSATFTLSGDEVYVRAEASTGGDNLTLTQPIMLRDVGETPVVRTLRRFVLLGA